MVVTVHHSIFLIQLVLSEVGVGGSILFLEVSENLLESLSALLLLQSLLRHVVCRLIELIVHLSTQLLVVHLMVVLSLHVLAELLAQFGLQFAHGLDSIHGGLKSTEQILLRDFLHLAFHHHDILS